MLIDGYHFGTTLARKLLTFCRTERLEPVVVLAGVDIRTELELRSSVEDDHVGRAAELKSANRLSFHYLISHINNRDAAGDLNHANLDDGYFSNPRVMSVDDEDVPCGDAAEEGLRVVVVVDPAHVEARILKEVAARKKVGALHGS